MLCPPSSQVMESPPPGVRWALACWLVGWWFFGLLGCFVGWLALGLLRLATPLAGWKVGWWLVWCVGGVCWLVWCVYMCRSIPCVGAALCCML